jgi:hypothetical protein
MVIATLLAAMGLWAAMVVPQVAGSGGGAKPPASTQGGAATRAAMPAPPAPTAAPVPPLSPAEFEKLLKDLVPRGSEPWETIPWRSDLLAARDEAIRTGRPLFLWAMNGHPLGCT